MLIRKWIFETLIKTEFLGQLLTIKVPFIKMATTNVFRFENQLGREFNQEKNINVAIFEDTRHGDSEVQLAFKRSLNEGEAVKRVETLLSKKITKKYFDERQEGTNYEDWKQAKEHISINGDLLGDKYVLEDIVVEDGTATLILGSCPTYATKTEFLNSLLGEKSPNMAPKITKTSPKKSASKKSASKKSAKEVKPGTVAALKIEAKNREITFKYNIKKADLVELLIKSMKADGLNKTSALKELHVKNHHKKDPDAPKRPMSAYMFFCGEKRESIKTSMMKGKKKVRGKETGTPSLDTKGVMKELGRMWREDIDDKQKAKYQKMAEKAKKEYLNAKQEYDAKNGKVQKPKKPRSAFIFYSIDARKKMEKGNVAEQSKVIGEMWRGLTDAKKEKYVNKAEEDKARYQQEMEEYRKEHPEEEKPKKTRKGKKNAEPDEDEKPKKTRRGKKVQPKDDGEEEPEPEDDEEEPEDEGKEEPEDEGEDGGDDEVPEGKQEVDDDATEEDDFQLSANGDTDEEFNLE